MLKCRQVCRLWKHLADGMLEKQPVWKPLFPYISTIPLIFIGGFGETVVRRIRGTKLNSATFLRQFLLDMQNHLDNPFPNRTVLLFSNPDLCVPNKRPRRGFYRQLPELLQKFGVHIWFLEYGVREDTTESVNVLRHFFELTSLRSLTIYARDWNKKSIRKRLQKVQHDITARQDQGEEFLGKLTHLQILGCNGILPLNYIFARVGEQIKSLYFCFLDDASTITSSGTASMGHEDGFRATEIDPELNQSLNYSLPDMTPNLTFLMVYEVTEEAVDRMFPSTGRRLSALKHMSVKLQRPFIRPLNRLVKAIDEHTPNTLETLHLEISRWPMLDNNEGETERDQVLTINSTVKLTKMLDLTISYALFLHEPEFLFKFADKCIQLKNITFVSVNIHSGSFPDFEGFCKPLWGRLPVSLETLRVRYWVCPDYVSKSTNSNGAGSNKKSSNKKPALPNPISRTQICKRPKVVIPRRV